ncbi:MAG: histidine kinase [Saprospiraceae bacterium]|nr:histidine kinase [Saprospiraceae bacterium]
MDIAGLKKEKNFWIAQAIGWAIFIVSNFVVQFGVGMPLSLVIANSGIAAFSGFGVTSIYRFLIKGNNWSSWSILQILVFVFFASFVLSVVWLVSTGLLFQLIMPQYQLSYREVLANMATGGSLFLIWNSIYFFFQYFSKFHLAEIEKWKLAAEMKEAQLGTLKAQINPHFVFNTLNNIKALILEDPTKARQVITDFSELFRYALLHSRQELSSLRDEIKIIEQYLDILSIQYEDRLRYQIQVDDKLLEEQIPPMILQLLVENAVKHGIAHAKEGGELVVEVKKMEKIFIIAVKNTGNLNSKASIESKLGTGLKNIRERLQLIYGTTASLELFEKAPYVIARLILPFHSPQKTVR